MKRINLLRAGSIALLVVGGNAAVTSEGVNAPTLADPQVAAVTARAMLVPGDSLMLNISAGIPVLDSLRADERWEQVADWAVYGTLFNSTLSASEIRDAMYDKVPLRLPGIEAAANLDYGPGRRVIQKDGSVWLFYAVDAPRGPTLARLADQARMDIGKIPERFSIFAIRSRLSSGAITVRREADIPGATMFSKEFGYVERTVASLDDLGGWLRDADDLTHVRLVDGGVQLGGRRLAEARTAGITVEDIGALYQAHTTLAEKNAQLDTSQTPVELAFSQVIDAFNRQVNRMNASQYSSLDSRELDEALDALEEQLDAGDATSSDPMANLERRLRRQSLGFGATGRSGLDGYRLRISEIRPQVTAAIASEHRARNRRFSKENGWTLTADPGFSLDPDVDSTVFRAGFRELVNNPDAVIARARSIARTSYVDRTGRNPVRPIARTAAEVVDAFAVGESPRLINASRTLNTDLASLDQSGLLQLHALSSFVETNAKLQCARYDGPLNGTRVGMFLFYTDLLAKIWLIDHGRSSPVDSVFGFLSALEASETSNDEPVYWREADSLSSTRLWFGPKKDAYSSQDNESELNFAHIATRVFSAGSDPANPGVESATAELMGRPLRWWDQHFALVAAYEPAYHTQNQIMKWSVVTAMLLHSSTLPDLKDVRVNHSERFDRWLAANTDLRYRGTLRLLPEDRWQTGTECLELLDSPTYRLGGTPFFLSGGVSLAGKSTLAEGTRISGSVAPSLRRAGLDFSSSSVDELVSLRSVKYRLPSSTNTRLASVEIRLATADQSLGQFETAMLRGQGTLYHVDQLQTQLFDLAGGARTFRLNAGTHELTSVAFRPRSGNFAIEVREGVAMADRKLVDVIANRAAENGSLAKAMAMHPETVPPSGYVVESQTGVSIVLDGSAGSTPRTLHLVTGDATSANKWITTAGVDFSQANPLRHVTTLSVERLDLATGLSQLNATKWQRISGRPGQPVSRVFGPEPPTTSTAVKVETGRADLGVVNARVADDGIYLERPTNTSANRAFNDLVFDQQITSERVAAIIGDSHRGSTQIQLVVDAPKPAQVLGDHIVAGDTRGMLRLLAEQGESGALNQSFKGLREYVAERGFTAYGTGKPSRAADLFLAADRATASPNELVYRAIASVERGEVSAALDDIGAAFQRGTPSEDALAAADRVFQARGHGGGIGNYGRWRTAGNAGGAGEPRLVQEGYRQQLLLVAERRSKEVPVSLEYRRAKVTNIVERDVIYVDEATLSDRRVLLERDPDLAPGRFAAEVVQDARIQLSQFDVTLRAGAPKKLAVGDRVYVRVDTKAAIAGLVGTVWLARSRCDNDQRLQSCRTGS